MMRDFYDVVVVGAGHAGVQAATSLIKDEYSGSIALISAEDRVPYERPPLSKGYLGGTLTLDELAFRKKDYWETSPIDLLRGVEVTEVLPDEKVVIVAPGRRIGYGDLIWATGVRPRHLPTPGSDLDGVVTIRTAADSEHIRELLPGVRKAVIVGAGYIGLEAAATLRVHDIEVVIVEAQTRVLQRVAGPVVSDFYERFHRDKGVDFRFSAGVAAIEPAGLRVGAVLLVDGERLPADLVLVGIGVVPVVEVLETAGAVVDNGVLTDAEGRTSLPHIFAIGDCARSPHPMYEPEPVRFESVPSAVEQANVVAATIAGIHVPTRTAPWFWSDQYDLKLKSVGLSAGADQTVVRGEPGTASFSVIYLRHGRVCAIDCVNRPKDFAHGKRLVSAGSVVEPAVLADDDVSLKDLLP